MKLAFTDQLWGLRSRFSGATRTRIRRATDPFIGPLGSIRGVRSWELVIGLTFDDGPDPRTTPGVLDVLARHGVFATFFVLVDRAEASPQLIRRILADGHEIGLHGVDHRRLTRLEPRQVSAHIQLGVQRLSQISGQAPRWFRPPYGSQDLRTYLAARQSGMEVVVWSADCEDWVQRPEQDIARQAIEAALPGGVLLLHDAIAYDPREGFSPPELNRPKIANLLLCGLTERGYRALSISSLLDGRPVHRTAWFRP